MSIQLGSEPWILIQVSIISSGFAIAQPRDLPPQRRCAAAKDRLPAQKLTQSNTSFSNPEPNQARSWATDKSDKQTSYPEEFEERTQERQDAAASGRGGLSSGRPRAGTGRARSGEGSGAAATGKVGSTRSGSALQRCGREVEMEMELAVAGGVCERQHGSQRRLEVSCPGAGTGSRRRA